MSTRFIYFLGFLTIVGILGVGFYLQAIDGFSPCPLCILQRFAFGALGIIFLLGLMLAKRRWARVLINLLALIFATVGLLLAGRQVWLQQFHSADGTECGVSLEYMLQVFPLHEVMQKVFAGSAECTQRGWEWMSLNMAEWAMVCFVGFSILSVYLILRDQLKR